MTKEWYQRLSVEEKSLVEALRAAQLYQKDMELLTPQPYNGPYVPNQSCSEDGSTYTTGVFKAVTAAIFDKLLLNRSKNNDFKHLEFI